MKLFGKELNLIIIKVTLILLFLATLYPPFIFRPGNPESSLFLREWGFLFHAPIESMTIDILTLLVEYVLILFLMCIVHLFMKVKEKS